MNFESCVGPSSSPACFFPSFLSFFSFLCFFLEQRRESEGREWMALFPICVCVLEA